MQTRNILFLSSVGIPGIIIFCSLVFPAAGAKEGKAEVRDNAEKPVIVRMELPEPDTSLMAHYGLEDATLIAVCIEQLRGPVDPEEGVTALNWFTINNPEFLARYGKVVGPLVDARGGGRVFSAQKPRVLEAPEGKAATGAAYVQGFLGLTYYPTSAAIADMIASPEWRAAGGLKAEGSNPDYTFGLQRCLTGCGPVRITGRAAGPTGPTLVHHFRLDYAEAERRISDLEKALKESGKGEMIYAGLVVAQPFLELEGGKRFYPMSVWMDGTLVIALKSPAKGAGAVPDDVLGLDAYQALREKTSEDVIVSYGGE